MCLGGGVPLIEPQEELRSPSGYTPRGFLEPRVGGEVRIFGFYNNKQKNERMKRRYKPNISALHTPEERLPSGAPKEEFGRMIFGKKSSLGDPLNPNFFPILTFGFGLRSLCTYTG